MSEHKENGLPSLEKTKNKYQKPFPRETVVTLVETEGPAHVGPFRGAIDYAMKLGMPVIAPLDGIVRDTDDSHSRFGPTEEFKDDANYITIGHQNDEFSQMVHLAKGSIKVKKGDFVKAGQQLAVTGNSGWMTEPHLHFLVFKLATDENGFKGLDPQLEDR